MSDPVARLNTALEGRYAIERELGEGGMATVYLAEDIKHHRKVALKVLKPELAAVVGAERFLAEIQVTANLTHPHILPLHDSGEADGFLFYVMPHIEGESLRERIDREKQLGVDESVAITQKVANALEYAHEHGVVHRDIKPGNILLSEQGEPLVADFGIALAVAQAGASRITILSVFLLTGGRASEVFGLLFDDIDLDKGLIHFLPNPWRQLKCKRHQRSVPLWPQLRETLTAYLDAHDRQSGDLLFPSRRGGMIKDLRGSLRAALEIAEIDKHTTLHSLRHTNTAARLQTPDSGAPISVYTVMRELGHSTVSLIEKTYGHLPDVRHRRPVVEYLETMVLELPRTA